MYELIELICVYVCNWTKKIAFIVIINKNIILKLICLIYMHFNIQRALLSFRNKPYSTLPSNQIQHGLKTLLYHTFLPNKV